MRSGVRPGSRASRIVALVRAGDETSRAVANVLDVPRADLSPEFCRLEAMGALRRLPSRLGGKGRPCVRWTVREATR